MNDDFDTPDLAHPDPWWFLIIWPAAAALTVLVCDMLPKGGTL